MSRMRNLRPRTRPVSLELPLRCMLRLQTSDTTLSHPSIQASESRRFAQTRAKPTSSTSSPHTTAQVLNTRRFRFLHRAIRIWYGLLLVGGAAAGLFVRDFVDPNPWPAPGTHEDEQYLEACTKEIELLEIVKHMRSQCPPRPFEPQSTDSQIPLPAPPPTQTDGQPAEVEHRKWIELDFKNNVVESKCDNERGYRTRTATFQTLAGIRGLGVQRAFLHAETKELVAVVWLGKSLGGWPGLAHGGAIATVFQDCMARMVAGPEVSLDTIGQPDSLSMTYAKKTPSHRFYIIRASFTDPKKPQTEPPPGPESALLKWSWLSPWKDLTKKEQHTRARNTVEIMGTLENVNGDLLVAAKGTFPVTG